jgi:hypothetical protein
MYMFPLEVPDVMEPIYFPRLETIMRDENLTVQAAYFV